MIKKDDYLLYDIGNTSEDMFEVFETENGWKATSMFVYHRLHNEVKTGVEFGYTTVITDNEGWVVEVFFSHRRVYIQNRLVDVSGGYPIVSTS